MDLGLVDGGGPALAPRGLPAGGDNGIDAGTRVPTQHNTTRQTDVYAHTVGHTRDAKATSAPTCDMVHGAILKAGREPSSSVHKLY